MGMKTNKNNFENRASFCSYPTTDNAARFDTAAPKLAGYLKSAHGVLNCCQAIETTCLSIGDTWNQDYLFAAIIGQIGGNCYELTAEVEKEVTKIWNIAAKSNPQNL